MKKIEFFRHCIDDTDIERASAVLRSIFLTTGQEVAEFERKFAVYTGQAHAVGLTSCTAALHLSLIALNIGTGDEVITTPMSFCARPMLSCTQGPHRCLWMWRRAPAI